MKVALIGYGRMGKEVEAILLERGHEVALRIDPKSGVADAECLSSELLAGIDGAIEFSLPAGVVHNARCYAQAGITAAVGTTGWEDKRDEVEKLIASGKASYVYGSNFSIGAHLMMALVAKAAELIRPFDGYDILLHEFHHKFKVDSPSGTALSIANVIMENLPRKTVVQTQALDRPIRPEELHVSSTRGGAFPGTHSVYLDSQDDTIEVTHTVRSRRGLAYGSVLALEWAVGRKGFFPVEEFIASTIAGSQA